MNKKLLLIVSSILILTMIAFSDTSTISKQPRSTYNIPDTQEAKEVMKTVERAYDIEAEARYTFDLKKFPTVFINDHRFPVSSGTLNTVRELTNNPSLEFAGWLDYKLAYYSWVRDATTYSEAIYAKAKAENRELTDKEKKSLIDPNGRIAPARAKDSIRHQILKFLSVNINNDIATVILDDGPTTIELTLVLVDNQWYVAGIKGVSIHP